MRQCPSCHGMFPPNFTHCPQDGTILITLREWEPGDVIRHKYRVLERIGSGGMGAVYKALHIPFGELRALKVINPALAADSGVFARFLNEAVVTRRLKHPNAVRVEDFDTGEDGRHFMVMEYVAGRTLRDVISEAPLSVSRFCSISLQVSAALSAAHQLGILHRDIKPSNILIVGETPNEQVKVVDFGIAKLLETKRDESITHDESLTSTGMVVGTPAYLSPEQALGKGTIDIDERSDLYSLGVVMYEMLTGTPPFKGSTETSLLMPQLWAPPKPLQEVRLDVPKSISELILQCLEKDRNLRPSTAEAIIRRIEEVQRFHSLSTNLIGASPEERHDWDRGDTKPGGIEGGSYSSAPANFSRRRRLAAWSATAALVIVIFALMNRLVLRNPDEEGSAKETASPTVKPVPAPAPASTSAKPTQERVEVAAPEQQVKTASRPVETTNQDQIHSETPREPVRNSVESTALPQVAQPTRLRDLTSQTPAASADNSRDVITQREEQRQAQEGQARTSEMEVDAFLAEGSIYETRGDYKKAADLYEEGLKLHPGNPQLKDKLLGARLKRARQLAGK
jgi:serine/threonine protein kinase